MSPVARLCLGNCSEFWAYCWATDAGRIRGRSVVVSGRSARSVTLSPTSFARWTLAYSPPTTGATRESANERTASPRSIRARTGRLAAANSPPAPRTIPRTNQWIVPGLR
jgi:hypothetical protein